MKRLYTVRDVKTGHYLTPFACDDHVNATREFQSATENPNTMIHRYPADFELYFLAEFDQTSGLIKSEKPEFIIGAISLTKKESSNEATSTPR